MKIKLIWYPYIVFLDCILEYKETFSRYSTSTIKIFENSIIQSPRYLDLVVKTPSLLNGYRLSFSYSPALSGNVVFDCLFKIFLYRVYRLDQNFFFSRYFPSSTWVRFDVNSQVFPFLPNVRSQSITVCLSMVLFVDTRCDSCRWFVFSSRLYSFHYYFLKWASTLTSLRYHFWQSNGSGAIFFLLCKFFDSPEIG